MNILYKIYCVHLSVYKVTQLYPNIVTTVGSSGFHMRNSYIADQDDTMQWMLKILPPTIDLRLEFITQVLTEHSLQQPSLLHSSNHAVVIWGKWSYSKVLIDPGQILRSSMLPSILLSAWIIFVHWFFCQCKKNGWYGLYEKGRGPAG